MTPSEHLQAAKEAVAKKYGYESWQQLFNQKPNTNFQYLHEAAELALTNQAEELRKDIVKFHDWCESGRAWHFNNLEQHTHTTEQLYKLYLQDKTVNP